eukprot:CAMPEP_0172457714 /NCGR_PEP_ID=MMETSP1065-20121228/23753_1 /TAXON_ID=265537 /ORGANISM="Amphiprora paludosa, Strain CCMP125" /LENGTH=279 /DNA_ID=CAMNT_0013211601 /DNA_START=131 /DNA_END=967 /DNA_ORIENTATION=+
MTLSDAWVDFVAGWCSGAAAVLALQPVDTVLTRWQAGLTVQTQGAGVGGAVFVRSMAKSLTETSGFVALWRGSSPMIGAVPIQNALLMGGYGVGQKYSEAYAPNHRIAAIFIGGCTGGVLQSFLMSPVELVKVSQQCAGKSLTAASSEVAWNIYHSTAWRGLGATLLRDGIPHGIWFAAYEFSKDGLKENVTEDPVLVPLTSGAIAATVAWAVGYPADLIKTRIQASTTPVGIMDTARQIIKESNGRVIAGLYQGFGLKLVRSVPASMIGFTTYELVKS